MKYFENITTIEQAKIKYKELAKAHHPDLGGCVEVMKEINKQYEKILQGVFETQGKSISDIEDLLKEDALLREKLNAVLSIPDVDVELCGKWIWITGNTKIVKDLIKAAGFFWAKQKCAWYWRSEENKGCNRKPLTIDEIRRNHGSISLKGSQLKTIG
jgi:hypothetical protein